ncbi:hypothetical protein [Anoxybacillus sp. MB8]|uniref:hypothetical protein n=1 Tax=Anoxybacillus sp. MB8 TaxID=2496850 RepID=UPI0013D5D215|nr:hypothetical protein [Anoxybacillus sp. MB8]
MTISPLIHTGKKVENMTAAEKPIYDERVKEILQGLAEGLTREELAEMFGHANYKTLDIYMRRRNFTWDREKMTYVPKISREKYHDEKVLPLTKAQTVIHMLKQPQVDIEEVCQKVGLKDHRELAEYMTAKGYIWSPQERNYVKKAGKVETTCTEPKEMVKEKENEEKQEERSVPVHSTDVLRQLQQYLPLLEMLQKHKDKLLEWIVPLHTPDTIPRYIILGRTSGKTIQMSDRLQDLIVEFCNQRNIKQRELFEVALIEFLKRYGYEYEVERLLQSHS